MAETAIQNLINNHLKTKLQVQSITLDNYPHIALLDITLTTAWKHNFK